MSLPKSLCTSCQWQCRADAPSDIQYYIRTVLLPVTDMHCSLTQWLLAVIMLLVQHSCSGVDEQASLVAACDAQLLIKIQPVDIARLSIVG